MIKSWHFSRKVALRYLWSKRAEAFISIITVISILGVAIGVMVLNVVMSVMTGFEKELKQRIISANSHIVVRALGGRIEDWPERQAAIEKIAGIESVSPFTQHQALLRSGDRSAGIIIRGVAPGTSAARQLADYLEIKESQVPLFDAQPLISRSGAADEDAVRLPALVVGRELARSMGLFIGMPVSLLTPQVSSSPFGLIPRFRRFVVAGIYSSGLVEYESGLAYASLEEAQKFFEFGRAVSGLEVRVRNFDQSPRLTKQIVETLGGLSSGLYAQDWTEINKPLWDALRLEKKVYFIVLLLIIVMASFSIITTLVMLVLEKRKDIAIMKTMGASARSVGLIFFLQGAVIGLVGTILGLMAGYFGSIGLREYGFPLDEKVFQMSTVPVRIEPLNFAVVGLCGFVICCLATIYPAWRASRLQPSEVLRYE